MNTFSPEFQLAVFQYKSALNFFGESQESKQALKKLLSLAPQWFIDELEQGDAND